MKKVLTFISCICIALCLFGCNSQKDNSSTDMNNESTSIANPFTDCDNIDTAKDLAGFGINLPKQYIPETIKVIKDKMIQVGYIINDNNIQFRKAVSDEDISGDYNEYSQVNQIDYNGMSVTVKGNDNLINVITWNDGSYSYSLTSDKGLSLETISSLISEINQ